MVNDQLIRIHHMRLLSYERMMAKQLHEQQNDASPHELLASSSNPSSPVQSKNISSSAPSTGLLGHHSFSQDSLSPSTKAGKKHKLPKRNTSLSKSQSFTPSKSYQGSAGKFKNNPSDLSFSGLSKVEKSSTQQTGKKKSSWRHLLSPSYKSRSDEFHKFFADEIPGDERLIADYSCALHREILIQGRVYISINYIAFYSNLFGWVTRLVVRLRDIADIYKANTARIIPNAIQIVTNSGDKHVFASFIARDKSYIMFWRIWRNNLLQEPMTNEEIRSLVHLGYGKDLGMNNDEELMINSPDPKTLADVLPESEGGGGGSGADQSDTARDGNNNGSNSEQTGVQPQEAADNRDTNVCDSPTAEPVIKCDSFDRSQCDSVDCHQAPDTEQAKPSLSDELSSRLQDVSQAHESPKAGIQANRSPTASPWSEINDASTPITNSSPIVVDSPELEGHNTKRDSHDHDRAEFETGEDGGQESRSEQRTTQAHFKNFFGVESSGSNSTVKDANEPATTKDRNSFDKQTANVDCDHTTASNSTNRQDSSHNDGERQAQRAIDEGDEESLKLNTVCDCDEHQGSLIADEEFDINVDTLFSLIFTNSKFMRAYMIRRGMTDTIVSKWRRSAAAAAAAAVPSDGGANSNNNPSSSGENWNTSTSSRSIEKPSETRCCDSNNELARPSVKSKQVRQLNYSINLNHVWAKQIQVEERQNICSVKSGVYVLKSQTINSGAPCSEAFTVDLTYCLTRASAIDKSRMRVHGGVNFIKDKQNWKLAMVKSVIERQSIQGINEFVRELITSVREYIDQKKQRLSGSGGGGGGDLDNISLFPEQNGSRARPIASGSSQQQQQQQQLHKSSSRASRKADTQRFHKRQNKKPLAGVHCSLSSGGGSPFEGQRGPSSRSLARVKSKLKERKLRHMYKYYIHASVANQDIDNDVEARSQQQRDTNQQHHQHGPNQEPLAGDHFERDDMGNSSDDSLVSSELGDLDDNDSMIMMMRTHEMDSSQLSDELEIQRRRGQSFSDLENGRSMDDDESGDDGDNEGMYSYEPGYDEGNLSETSNVTISNYQRRSRLRGKQTTPADKNGPTDEPGDDERRTRSMGHGRLSSSVQSCGRLEQRTSTGRPMRTSLLRRTAQASSSSRLSSSKGLFSSRRLLTYSIILALLLLAALVVLHVILLRRLGGIEATLVGVGPSCNPSGTTPSRI